MAEIRQTQKSIRFTVQGRAVPYTRTTRKEAIIAHHRGDSAKDRRLLRYWQWKESVGWQAKAARMPPLSKDAWVEIECTFYMTRPLPDIDNLAKGVLDALNGVAYPDDRQVMSVVARRVDVQQKKDEITEIVVSWGDNQGEDE